MRPGAGDVGEAIACALRSGRATFWLLPLLVILQAAYTRNALSVVLGKDTIEILSQ